MLKIIPISAVLLLSVVSAYGQNGTYNSTSTSPVSTSPDTTDSMDSSADTTPATTNTPNGSATSTSTDISTTPVTPTPVTTTPTPVITPASVTTTPATNTTTSSSTSTTTTSTLPANAYICVGANPMWNLTVSKNLITYSSSKDPSVKIKGVTSTIPVGDSTGNIQTFTAKDNSNHNVTILINKNATSCANAPSGQTYAYDAFIVFQNQVYVGCCNPR